MKKFHELFGLNVRVLNGILQINIDKISMNKIPLNHKNS